MQLINCTPWSIQLHPHPTIIKKVKTFLEVEGKMGPIPQPASNRYRPPQLNTNPKVRKDNTTEKRKRAVFTKRVRPSAAPKSGETNIQPLVTVSKVSEAPENRPPPLEKAPVHESTPWPGAGRMSGNLCEDRNWVLPPNYLNNDHKNATSPKSPIKKNLRQVDSPSLAEMQRNVDGDQIVPSAKIRRRKIGMANTKANRRFHPFQKYKDPR